MKIWTKILLILFVLLICVAPLGHVAQAEGPVVHALLFFSHSCPHCQKVIDEDLPPLIEKYGDQLQILGINTSTPEGQALYQDTIEYLQIPDERVGVPTLIVADTVLVGSAEIPDQFPGIVENGLQNGGIDWPSIPGLAEIVAEDGTESESSPTVAENGTEAIGAELSIADRFKLDLAGNTLAVLVLVAMLASVFSIGANFTRSPAANKWPRAIPILSVVGMIVTGYLAYVEVTQSEAVCGPVGKCNVVQQSPYALLFGVLPMGVFGLIGHVLIIAGWAMQHYGPKQWRTYATLSVWGMALFGTLFSIYLTFLEPFVIGASCAWCLASAVIITMQLWAATGPAKISMAGR
ncbi:MAG: vitamin K epoxide reductase family protein [Chloroflexota bacterium]